MSTWKQMRFQGILEGIDSLGIWIDSTKWIQMLWNFEGHILVEYRASWWYQPIWKNMSQIPIILPGIGMNMKKQYLKPPYQVLNLIRLS